MNIRTFRSRTALGLSALLLAGLLSGCSDSEVADVSLGFLTFKNIKLDAFVDEKIPGVTCHVASIESPLTLADPSDSAISCRQTGDITPAMIDAIDKFELTKGVKFETYASLRIRGDLHTIQEHLLQDHEDPPHLRSGQPDAHLPLLLNQGDERQLQALHLHGAALGLLGLSEAASARSRKRALTQKQLSKGIANDFRSQR